ncbi:MAG: hypothetical protein JWN41_1023, partial [Thermoleophilia bacterium]|nr:hypothetical protein [Thermoleophilia bacterium]
GHGVTPPAAPANRSVALDTEELTRADAVMVLTDHSGIDWHSILECASLTVDFRNVYSGTPKSERLWKL